jgi:hypothetical protein
MFTEKLFELSEIGVELPPGDAEPVRLDDGIQPAVKIITRAAAGIE